jgi:hypothetical protein
MAAEYQEVFRMPPYKEKYPVRTVVRIPSSEKLIAFKLDWKYHNPISDEQIKTTNKIGRVKNVGFYHGGDAQYVIEDIEGIWHEELLDLANSSA